MLTLYNLTANKTQLNSQGCLQVSASCFCFKTTMWRGNTGFIIIIFCYYYYYYNYYHCYYYYPDPDPDPDLNLNPASNPDPDVDP